jgi:hypothetical protein
MPLSSLFARALPLLGVAVLAWSLQTWLPAASLSQAAMDTREQLRGTWLREYSEDGFQVRRVLSLAGDGAFHEKVRVADRAGKVTEFAHEGQWLFDGTNLKRKYTLMDGKPPSRLNVPFATIEVAFQSSNDFIGIDHVHRRRMEYRRLAQDR